MLHKVWDRKETFFDYKNENCQRLKKGIFPKWLTHGFDQKKEIFFANFFSVKKGLEMRLNDFLDRKKLLLTIKKNFQCLKNGIFQKELTHAFSQNMEFFSLFFFSSQKRTRNKVEWCPR